MDDASPREGGRSYMTPEGYRRIRAEYEALLHGERPRVVEVVSWAAGNGDRSENGDYQYGKKRLREIDRRVRYLGKRLDSAEVVDPARQPRRDRVFFGATVTYVCVGAGEDDRRVTVTIVGEDEAAMAEGKVSLVSPVARALLRATVGDEVAVQTPGGVETVEVVSISYPAS